MKKKTAKSTVHRNSSAKSANHKDSKLNFSDIPEATDDQLRRARRATVIGLGKFRSAILDLGSNKKQLRNLGR
jgi:hypothetical protein